MLIEECLKIKKDYSRIIGQKYITNQGYEVEILDATDRLNVKIKFNNVDENFITIVTLRNLKMGEVSYPFHPNKYGFYLGDGKYKSRKNGVKTQAYKKWSSIIVRCYRNQQKSYEDVYMCEAWKNFQNFAKWFYENNYKDDLVIDRDIINIFNKEYSDESCMLVPKEINSIFVKRIYLPKLQNSKFLVKEFEDNKYKKHYFDDYETSIKYYNYFVKKYFVEKYEFYIESVNLYKNILPNNIYSKIIKNLQKQYEQYIEEL